MSSVIIKAGPPEQRSAKDLNDKFAPIFDWCKSNIGEAKWSWDYASNRSECWDVRFKFSSRKMATVFALRWA